MPRTVVIAEDEFLLALDLQEMCEGLGCKVLSVARSAPEARKRFMSLTPDVLLTDMDLGPGGDGVNVVEELREHCARVVVVFVTASSHPEALARINSASPDFILSKPLTPRALREVLLPKDSSEIGS